MLWPKDTSKARKLQESLKKKVRIAPLKKQLKYVAGVDAAFSGDRIIGAACLFKFPEVSPVEESFVVMDVNFPYVPGLLSFREGPAVIKALKALKKRPDIVLFDGQGIAHPKNLGIASHIGVILDTPTVGCAKSRLVGAYREPGPEKESRTPLNFKGSTVGSVLRTRDNTRPVFVSPGHRIDIRGSVEVVLACTGKFRIPEPIRCADILSRKIKKALDLQKKNL